MPTLPHRPLGNTGLQVSPLGLAGSHGIDAPSVERAFHELGINYFFVTPRMKGVVAGLRALIAAGHRDELVLASGANLPTGWSIPRELGRITRALGTDRVDVWHLFYVQARWYVTGKTWPTMLRLRKQGRVRALAISCHDRTMARRLVDELSLDALMIRYNAAHRGAESEVFATLPDPRPGIVTYTATRWGKLLHPTGHLSPMTAPECYRFVLGHPAVDVSLCSPATYDELSDDVRGVLEGPLPDERLVEVRAFGDAVRAAATGRVGFWRP